MAKGNGREVARKQEWNTLDRQDVTDSLMVGENTIDIAVTAGTPSPFGPSAEAKTVSAALAALVKISLLDGSVQRFGTDGRWEAKLDAESDWQASQVIGELSDKQLGDPGQMPQPAVDFRRDVALSEKNRSAMLYDTAL